LAPWESCAYHGQSSDCQSSQFIPCWDKKSSLYYRPKRQKPNGYKTIEKNTAILAVVCRLASDAAVMTFIFSSGEPLKGRQSKKGT